MTVDATEKAIASAILAERQRYAEIIRNLKAACNALSVGALGSAVHLITDAEAKLTAIGSDS